MRLSEKRKLSLVLSGGGVKAAAFHIGVCLALRDKGFKFAGGGPENIAKNFASDKMTFKSYVGSSAGSFIASFLAGGYSIESIIESFTQGVGMPGFARRQRTEGGGGKLPPLKYKDIFRLNIETGNPARFMPKFFNKKKPIISGGLEVLLKKGFKVNGIFNTKNIESYMQGVIEEDSFDSLGVDLYIIATQLNHSRKVIFGHFNKPMKNEEIQYANYAKVSQAVAASTALPPAYSPYGIKNNDGKEIFYFDGEIRDTLSTHIAADHGADLVIASYSMQPYHYTEEIGSLHEYGIPAIINQALYQSVQQKINSHIKHRQTMTGMMNAVNGYLKEIELPQEQREKLMDILTSRTGYRSNLDKIYIHPSSTDYQMFFYDHFSLNPKILSKIVKVGFRSAMKTLRQYNL